jgi:hypothetical protein
MEIEYMPIHPNDIKLPNCPQQVPMSLLNERRAKMNHSQTLLKLKQRGGLSVKEMLSVITDKSYEYYGNMAMPFAIAALNKILEQQTKQTHANKQTSTKEVDSRPG